MFDPLLAALEQELRTDFHQALTELLTTARTRLEEALAEVARERAEGLTEVATQKAELRREIEAMQAHAEKQQGRIELNIGGHRFQTSVQTLRRLPHTFFDAYFSGRYAQDVCLDGSIFVDRDGEHFGHVLEYMRDGVVSVAEADARPSVSLLRALKREFGYYCVELVAEQPVEPSLPETVHVMGGRCGARTTFSSMERYDAASGQWSTGAPMCTARSHFGSCVIAGEIYVTGGQGNRHLLSCAEKYSPSSDTWSAVAPMREARYLHVAVAVGSDMYVLGGSADGEGTRMDVLKFDSIKGTWTEVESAPRDIHKSAAIVMGTDIYVFGGEEENAVDDSVMKYDTVADEWSNLAPMPSASSEHSAIVCNGLVYIVGAGEDCHDFLRFDPVSAVWNMLAPTLCCRSYCATFVVDGGLYAAKGFEGSRSVERYDAATDTWTAVADMLEGRYAFGAVTIGSAGPAEEQDLFDSLIDKLPSATMRRCFPNSV
jgi:hypothetical protein